MDTPIDHKLSCFMASLASNRQLNQARHLLSSLPKLRGTHHYLYSLATGAEPLCFAPFIIKLNKR